MEAESVGNQCGTTPTTGARPMTGVESCPYHAFLFYSHRETRWAKRLHRVLEGLVTATGT